MVRSCGELFTSLGTLGPFETGEIGLDCVDCLLSMGILCLSLSLGDVFTTLGTPGTFETG